jgi:hypothetical protein
MHRKVLHIELGIIPASDWSKELHHYRELRNKHHNRITARVIILCDLEVRAWEIQRANFRTRPR